MQDKIKFHTGSQLLAKYLCFTAKSITLGHFPAGNYHVLPRLIPQNTQVVYFPCFSYSTRFWQTISKIDNYSLATQYPEAVITEAGALLSDYTEPDVSILINDWQQYSPSFFKLGREFLDFKFLTPQISSIDILLTEFGTIGSFSYQKTADKYRIICTSRIDFGWSNICWMIIQSILHAQYNFQGDVGTSDWYQRNAILNYLQQHTELGRKIPTPESNRHLSPEIIHTSQEYLTILGFPPGNHIDVFALEKTFTPQELIVWKLIFASPGIIVSFDSIADALWGSSDQAKYSLYSIAKLIQNLRTKIQAQGVKRPVIHTIRKRGYIYL